QGARGLGGKSLTQGGGGGDASGGDVRGETGGGVPVSRAVFAALAPDGLRRMVAPVQECRSAARSARRRIRGDHTHRAGYGSDAWLAREVPAAAGAAGVAGAADGG